MGAQGCGGVARTPAGAAGVEVRIKRPPRSGSYATLRLGFDGAVSAAAAAAERAEG
jgi:hypothetical protein